MVSDFLRPNATERIPDTCAVEPVRPATTTRSAAHRAPGS